MAGNLFCTQPLLTHWHKEQTWVKFESKYNNSHPRKCSWKCCLQNVGNFADASPCLSFSLPMYMYLIHRCDKDHRGNKGPYVTPPNMSHVLYIYAHNNKRRGHISQTVMNAYLKSWKSTCCIRDSRGPIRLQICTCHNRWAVVTYAKLWPNKMIIIHVEAIRILRNILDHELLNRLWNEPQCPSQYRKNGKIFRQYCK